MELAWCWISWVDCFYYTGCLPVYSTHAVAFELLSILGQPPRDMERVLHNLLRNALQFAVQVVCITVMVVDDEINILVDDRERIFAPFTRLEDSRNRSTGGYGLGLAIAKRIIDAHHGVITVHDSTLGGACFRIQLSAVKQH